MSYPSSLLSDASIRITGPQLDADWLILVLGSLDEIWDPCREHGEKYLRRISVKMNWRGLIIFAVIGNCVFLFRFSFPLLRTHHKKNKNRFFFKTSRAKLFDRVPVNYARVHWGARFVICKWYSMKNTQSLKNRAIICIIDFVSIL